MGYLPLAAQLSEGAAELLEMAFEWDSPLAAEAWREVCTVLSDFM